MSKHTPPTKQLATILEVLIAARKLIEKPEHWCQHMQGRTIDGLYCDPDSKETVQRCALGALNVAAGAFLDEPCIGEQTPLTALAGIVGPSKECPNSVCAAVTGFNNTHTHAEVLAAFDKAIEAERAKVVP